MLSKRTKDRIRANKLRREDWRDAEKRRGYKAALVAVRTAMGGRVENNDAYRVISFARGFVDIPDVWPSIEEARQQRKWTIRPDDFQSYIIGRWQRRVVPHLPRVTTALLMACQKARRDSVPAATA
jgi:hypothetical protein